MVRTGPSEATAVGNIAAQLIASEELEDLSDARTMVGASFPSEVFEPSEADQFKELYEQFVELVEKVAADLRAATHELMQFQIKEARCLFYY